MRNGGDCGWESGTTQAGEWSGGQGLGLGFSRRIVFVALPWTYYETLGTLKHFYVPHFSHLCTWNVLLLWNLLALRPSLIIIITFVRHFEIYECEVLEPWDSVFSKEVSLLFQEHNCIKQNRPAEQEILHWSERILRLLLWKCSMLLLLNWRRSLPPPIRVKWKIK